MQSFFSMLEHLNMWYWFGFGAVLVILEMLLGVNFFLLWTGISAASIGLVMLVYPQIPWEYQFVIFSMASIGCIVFWNLHLKHTHKISDEPRLNRRSEQYVGRVVTLLDPIVNGRGRIIIDDSSWRIEGPDLAAGTAVKIVGVDGVVLKVEKD